MVEFWLILFCGGLLSIWQMRVISSVKCNCEAMANGLHGSRVRYKGPLEVFNASWAALASSREHGTTINWVPTDDGPCSAQFLKTAAEATCLWQQSVEGMRVEIRGSSGRKVSNGPLHQTGEWQEGWVQIHHLRSSNAKAVLHSDI